MQSKNISIKGARTHNLANIDIDIPRDALTVITGLSGSGKSSLAFDTLYAEGQRRYVESMSAYARQFLSLMDKPEVDSIDGLSPAISIEQKSTSHNPRSTVGTVTEIYDYMRLLFARIGVPHCPTHHIALEAMSTTQIVNQLLGQYDQDRAIILAPLVHQQKGTHADLIQSLLSKGFMRGRANGEYTDLADIVDLDKNKRHTIDLVIDRLKIRDDVSTRISESIEQAVLQSGSVVAVHLIDKKEELLFSTTHSCPKCGFSMPTLEPKLFSFNNPAGACGSCEGLGRVNSVSLEYLLRSENLSLAQGALAGWGRNNTWNFQLLNAFAQFKEIDTSKPWKELSTEQQDLVLNGSKEKFTMYFRSSSGNKFKRQKPFIGVLDSIARRYDATDSVKIREDLAKFFSEQNCRSCNGTRLNEGSSNVLIQGNNLPQLSKLSIADAKVFFEALKLKGAIAIIGSQIKNEILSRLSFLNDVGLTYLSLSRSAHTLSGGESQRIRLASQIGTGLVGVMYILDEPSIGLHQRDNARLLKTLKHLRDLGNAVIVVEHDEEAILNADFVLDIGPGAGIHGGKICAQGTPQDIMACQASLTGNYLSGKQMIPMPKKRRKSSSHLIVKEATDNNLKNVTLKLPLGIFVCVTGVSGSGKSTLINQTLYPAAANALNRAHLPTGKCSGIDGLKHLDKVIEIDQSPIGRTPRSNPATYTKLFDPIRDLFSKTPEARSRGYMPGRFSFNVKGGRCEHCKGDGLIRVEMHFLADVYVTCDECKGKRYNQQTLEIEYKGKNISDILEMTVEIAVVFFAAIPNIHAKLKTLNEVGLSYIKVGQSATTLSGGEAQRIKLAKELSRAATGKTLYLLDEPTTGLHFHDIRLLLEVLHKLVDAGNSVIVIEHNLDFIKTADWIVDMGPEGGDAGGSIIVEGSPEAIVKNEKSYTAQYLAKTLSIDKARAIKNARKRRS